MLIITMYKYTGNVKSPNYISVQVMLIINISINYKANSE